MKKTDAILSRLSRLYEKADMFGYRIQLSLQRKKFVRSKFSATMTILVMLAFLYYFYFSLVNWSNNSDLQTISSVRSYSTPQITSQNLSSFYDFNYQNYNIYFALMCVFPNRTTLNHIQLKPYLTQEVLVGTQTMDLEPCNQGKQQTFLMGSQSDIQAGANVTSKFSLCLKNSFKLLFQRDNHTGGVYRPSFTYFLSRCQNSTENNFSCAPDAEINEVIKYAYVQMSLPKNIYDFTDPIMPRKRIYDNKIYLLDNSLTKLYIGAVLPIQVKTDVGLFYEDYAVDSTDFNIDGGMQYELNLRDSKDMLLIQYTLQLSYNTQTYYRKNVKFLEMFASLGGTLNILMIIGRFIGLAYNSHLFRYRLMNYSFENLDVDNDNR